MFPRAFSCDHNTGPDSKTRLNRMIAMANHDGRRGNTGRRCRPGHEQKEEVHHRHTSRQSFDGDVSWKTAKEEIEAKADSPSRAQSSLRSLYHAEKLNRFFRQAPSKHQH